MRIVFSVFISRVSKSKHIVNIWADRNRHGMYSYRVASRTFTSAVDADLWATKTVKSLKSLGTDI